MGKVDRTYDAQILVVILVIVLIGWAVHFLLEGLESPKCGLGEPLIKLDVVCPSLSRYL